MQYLELIKLYVLWVTFRVLAERIEIVNQCEAGSRNSVTTWFNVFHFYAVIHDTEQLIE